MSRPQLLDTDQAAEFLGISPNTLTTWRCTQRYDLAFIKVGGLVRYREEDLNQFLESRTKRQSE